MLVSLMSYVPGGTHSMSDEGVRIDGEGTKEERKGKRERRDRSSMRLSE